MINHAFAYASEKLSTARRILMAPHPKGEEHDFVAAFHECTLGLKDVPRDKLDDNARRWVRIIEHTMDTKGIDDPAGHGTWLIKAGRLTEAERYEFAKAVDELTYWFER